MKKSTKYCSVFLDIDIVACNVCYSANEGKENMLDSDILDSLNYSNLAIHFLSDYEPANEEMGRDNCNNWI